MKKWQGFMLVKILFLLRNYSRYIVIAYYKKISIVSKTLGEHSHSHKRFQILFLASHKYLLKHTCQNSLLLVVICGSVHELWNILAPINAHMKVNAGLCIFQGVEAFKCQQFPLTRFWYRKTITITTHTSAETSCMWPS